MKSYASEMWESKDSKIGQREKTCSQVWLVIKRRINIRCKHNSRIVWALVITEQSHCLRACRRHEGSGIIRACNGKSVLDISMIYHIPIQSLRDTIDKVIATMESVVSILWTTENYNVKVWFGRMKLFRSCCGVEACLAVFITRNSRYSKTDVSQWVK